MLPLLLILFPMTFFGQAQKNNLEKLKNVWMLVKFEKFSKEQLVQNEAQIRINDSNSGSAQMGCNDLHFSFKVKNDKKIQFSDVISTKKMCMDIALENAFCKKLKTFTKYKIEGHFLILTNSKNEEMKFIEAAWD